MKKHLICFLLLLPSFLYSQSLSVSNLPIVRFNTNTRVIQDEPKIPVQMEIFDNGPGQLNQVSSTPTISTVAGVEFRGSTSQADFYFLPGLVKKPYGIELWTDSTGVKSKRLSLVQMPEESDWVLNASYNDRSFMRDFIAQSLAGRIGLLHSKAKFVELIINDEYRGVYVLMEKVKQGKNRVPISDLYPTENAGDDVTGGYLLKIDKSSGSPSSSWKSNYTSGITATQKCEFQIEYPQYGIITQQQLIYIRDYINNWENKLMTEDMNDPKASFRDYMDVSSFVNYFILNEVTRNVDGYRLSTYLYKDKESLGGKIKMGPAWDFNIALGNADYLEGWKTDGFVYKAMENDGGKNDYWQVPFWWNKLMQDASFRKALATRWKAVRSSFLNTNTLFATIDSAQIALKDPLTRNFQKYPLMGKKIWPNYYVGASLSDEVNWLKNWIQGRLVWLDAQMAVFDSPILAVREEDASAIVYPNPSTSGLFQWKFSLDKPSLVTYFISDAMGRMILSPKNANFGSGEQIQSLDLSMFPSGTYLLSWKMEDGLVQQIKILR
ncbi:CotH kinase family protein [Aquirufa antheringensis]|uniref:T9SS type A sorting domain-containing protein n=1 Tax=Aquirufa antheringensis TaxID=2516559 RepID=A0A4Q9BA97_9BACT|nr:CotH kinase family protein [Aquirufa antheringensis]MCZ2486734.1 T9SS type A sorting domain-containing protein [Aquirufa antheringensis]MCZ2488485.1 T9SS type A sorting domain-containing protein [Aquirufa antheringensis]TBH71961.1 T9SS type A sorting domain-containing protein [Aquirufa antheringensis]